MPTASHHEVDSWLDERANGGQSANRTASPARPVAPAWIEAEFKRRSTRIHAYIEAGDTYQVNYTYRLRFDAYGSLLRCTAAARAPAGALWRADRPARRQRRAVAVARTVRAPCSRATLTARPMKGTAPASGDAQQDATARAALAADPKNRAENLMIVDLLRNDLGRVAHPGTVQVPELFDVKRYSSVLQMTSTVQRAAARRRDAGGHVHALYPCGSITGAPKRRTMQIIRELETDAARHLHRRHRLVRCARKRGTARRRFCLSVPIRTLVLQAPQRGRRAARRNGRRRRHRARQRCRRGICGMPA